MTLKQKIEDQIQFSLKRYEEAKERGDDKEMFKWGGYVQGLRFVLGLNSDECSCGGQCGCNRGVPLSSVDGGRNLFRGSNV